MDLAIVWRGRWYRAWDNRPLNGMVDGLHNGRQSGNAGASLRHDRAVSHFLLDFMLNMLSPLVMNELWGLIQQMNWEPMVVHQVVKLRQTYLSTWYEMSRRWMMRVFGQCPCDLAVVAEDLQDTLRDPRL